MIELTLSQLLRDKTKANPEHEFMVYADRDLRFTYAQFDKRVDDLACGLYAIGVRKGDNIGIWATNVPDWLTYMFACARLGAVGVTVNTSYKSHELEYLVKQADLTTLCLCDGIKDSNYVAMIKELVPEIDEYERGCLKSKRDKELWQVGTEEMIRVLEPTDVLVHGYMPEEIFGKFFDYADFHRYPSLFEQTHKREEDK